MRVDPSVPPQIDATGRLLERVAALERQVRELQSYLQGGSVQQIPSVNALPAAGRKGRLVFLTTDSKVYKDTGAAWANPL